MVICIHCIHAKYGRREWEVRNNTSYSESDLFPWHHGVIASWCCLVSCIMVFPGVVNPRHACAASVTVLVAWCNCVMVLPGVIGVMVLPGVIGIMVLPGVIGIMVLPGVIDVMVLPGTIGIMVLPGVIGIMMLPDVIGIIWCCPVSLASWWFTWCHGIMVLPGVIGVMVLPDVTESDCFNQIRRNPPICWTLDVIGSIHRCN